MRIWKVHNILPLHFSVSREGVPLNHSAIVSLMQVRTGQSDLVEKESNRIISVRVVRVVYEVPHFVLKHFLCFTNILNGVLAGSSLDKDMMLACLFDKPK